MIWLALGTLGLNSVAGFGRAESTRKFTDLQRAALCSIKQSINRVLPGDVRLDRSVTEAEKELSNRFVSYSGEEVPKMQTLSIAAAKGALPPKSHGGSVDALAFVSGGTRWFLEHPEESLVKEIPPGSKLQAKVHIVQGESLEFCQLLIDRQICVWVPDDEVLTFGGQKVFERHVRSRKRNTFRCWA